MPSYEYICAECGVFQASRSMAEAATPHTCPECGTPAPRALSRPHVRTAGAGLHYLAESRNEKSAHEPTVEHRLKSANGHYHGHAKHQPGRRAQRPWMIGH